MIHSATRKATTAAFHGRDRCDVAHTISIATNSPTTGDRYYASHVRRTVTVLRLFRFDLTADDMIEKIHAHMLVADDKEIAGAVAIRSADPKAHPYNIAMLPVTDWYFRERRGA